MSLLLGALAVVVTVGACGGGDDPPEPIFTAAYADTFEVVRDCVRSIDHDFEFVRILADPAALAPYRDREAEFPVGAVVVKEQYADNDDACAGEVLRFTAMRKLEAGSATDLIDWEWQEQDPDHEVVGDIDQVRCARCHETCELPEGYLGTCSAPG